MKKTLFLVYFVLSSLSAYGINPQDGNGGNICAFYPDIHSSQLSYITFEEFYYSDFYKQRRPADYSPKYKQSPLVLNSFRLNLKTTDLTSTKAGLEVKKAIAGLRSRNITRNFSLLFEDAFRLLQNVLVTQVRFPGPAVPRNFQMSCDGMTAAIVTGVDGVTLLDHNAWNALSFESQRILLIHETLRIMSIFSPNIFMGDYEIVYWTKQISSGDAYSAEIEEFEIGDKEIEIFFSANILFKKSKERFIDSYRMALRRRKAGNDASEGPNDVKHIFLKHLQEIPANVSLSDILSYYMTKVKTEEVYWNIVSKYLPKS